ncbi:MAG: hypothetical protein H8D49_06070 [Dehalococcoidia bacterium]|nr:hypothetical protein [Dehalococcoidia bacterium]
MEKWRDEIEELLARNRTVDRWIIHDFVWKEDQSAHATLLAAMSHLMTAMRLLSAGPCAISEAELKERINRSFAAAGLPREMVDAFFEGLNSGISKLPPWAGPLFKETDAEETNEASGDDE